MLCHHREEILLAGGETARFLCHIISFKEHIDYTGCNPNGDVDYLENFQSPLCLQLARKYSSD